MAKQYENGAATKKKILDAAIRLSEESGFDNLNIRNICKEANVTIGAFYHHFKHKNDLMSAICINKSVHFIPVIKTVLKGKSTAEQIEVYAYYYAKLNEYTGLEQLRIMYSPESHWFQKKRDMQSVLEMIIRTGQEKGDLIETVDAHEIQEYLTLVLRGCVLDWCMFDCEYDLAEKTTSYIRYSMQTFFKAPPGIKDSLYNYK